MQFIYVDHKYIILQGLLVKMLYLVANVVPIEISYDIYLNTPKLIGIIINGVSIEFWLVVGALTEVVQRGGYLRSVL